MKKIIKIFKFTFILLLMLGWVFNYPPINFGGQGWPRIFNFPPAIKEAQAATINILPNAKHANDNTTELIGEITADDATCDPDATSGVAAGDGCYTVDKNIIMQLDTFDVSSIPDSSTISAAVLHLQYGAENGYSGTNPVRYDNGAGLTTTGITPSDIAGWSADLTFDLYAPGVDTKTELQNVDIEFTSNDGAGPDAINFDYVWITVDYTLPTYEQSAYRLFNNLDSTDVGTALAAQDTAATLGSTGALFRLRMLLHIGANQLIASGQTFKLQFATQSGTCDTGFVGETYADVTAATVVAYKDNATPADGANLTANANDPTHGADTIVNQTYEELNNFTNSVAAIPAAQDGKWDFALFDNGATANTAYCLRAVKSDGTVLNTYTQIPQITTATAAPSQTLTFSISDPSIGFGMLDSANERWATGDGAGSTTEVSAHTISASTNGTNGYIITIDGNTLTSGANTITAIGASAVDITTGNGTEQFGIRLTASGGNGAVSSPYNGAANNYALDTAAFPDQIASDPDGDNVSTTYSIFYATNIAGATEAGSYNATLTYVATGNF